MAPQLDALRRTALLLVVAGLLWNLVEAGISLWAGAQAGSVALLAFGLDSIVELLAGGVLVWRLLGDRKGTGGRGRGEKGTETAGAELLPAGYIHCPSFRGQPAGVVARAAAEPRRRRDCGGKRRCDGWPVRGQDAHRHPDSVPVVEGGGHGKPVLRPSGPDHPGRTGVQRLAFLVVGRPGGSPGLDSLCSQGGHGELLGP